MSPAAVVTPLGRELVENPLIYENLWIGAHKWARSKGQGADAAENLYQEMAVEVLELEASGKWTPGGPVSAFALCKATMVKVAGRIRRADSRHGARSVDASGVELVSGAAGPEALVAEADLRESLSTGIRKDLKERGEQGELPAKILDASDAGIEGHEELAAHIGCSPKEIADAQRRLTAAGKRVAAQLGVMA